MTSLEKIPSKFLVQCDPHTKRFFYKDDSHTFDQRRKREKEDLANVQTLNGTTFRGAPPIFVHAELP